MSSRDIYGYSGLVDHTEKVQKWIKTKNSRNKIEQSCEDVAEIKDDFKLAVKVINTEDIALKKQQHQCLEEENDQDYVLSEIKQNNNEERQGQRLLKWRDDGQTVSKMCRGATAVKDNTAYFMDWSGKTYSYDAANRKWREMTKCPYQYASMVFLKDRLTAIGGCTDMCKFVTYTNKLLSLHENCWAESFPPMPTKRRDTTAISTEQHLIVAGGMCGPFINACVATVEIMDTNSLVWSTVVSLPHVFTGISSAVCGDSLYLLGGFDDKNETKSVLTCSLTELLQSSSSSSSVWHRVADTPAYQSTCAAVNEELFAVGGCDKEDRASAAVHKYNPMTDSWNLISKMPTPRYNCLVAVIPTNEMTVVGGDVRWNKTIDNVVIASLNYLTINN